MKKAISVLMIFAIILCCFAGCKKKYKGTEQLTQPNGETYNLKTEKGGTPETNENGDFLEVVTNQDGKKVTQIHDGDFGIVYGNKIYFDLYNITIPEGWESKDTANDANLVDDKGNHIRIMYKVDADMTEETANAKSIFNAVKTKYPDSKITEKKVKVLDKDCQFLSVFIPEVPENALGFMGYVYIIEGGVLLRVYIESAEDLTNNMDDILAVLNTIEFTNQGETTK